MGPAFDKRGRSPGSERLTWSGGCIVSSSSEAGVAGRAAMVSHLAAPCKEVHVVSAQTRRRIAQDKVVPAANAEDRTDESNGCCELPSGRQLLHLLQLSIIPWKGVGTKHTDNPD
eukprot:scaffold57817_cov30-Tisochrysis_lutea.AAC.2